MQCMFTYNDIYADSNSLRLFSSLSGVGKFNFHFFTKIAAHFIKKQTCHKFLIKHIKIDFLILGAVHAGALWALLTLAPVPRTVEWSVLRACMHYKICVERRETRLGCTVLYWWAHWKYNWSNICRISRNCRKTGTALDLVCIMILFRAVRL